MSTLLLEHKALIQDDLHILMKDSKDCVYLGLKSFRKPGMQVKLPYVYNNWECRHNTVLCLMSFLLSGQQ